MKLPEQMRQRIRTLAATIEDIRGELNDLQKELVVLEAKAGELQERLFANWKGLDDLRNGEFGRKTDET